MKGGSALNMFDWNGKSRKKLFSDSSIRPGMTVNSYFPRFWQPDASVAPCHLRYIIMLKFDSIVEYLIAESANQGKVKLEMLPEPRLLQTVRVLLLKAEVF